MTALGREQAADDRVRGLLAARIVGHGMHLTRVIANSGDGTLGVHDIPTKRNRDATVPGHNGSYCLDGCTARTGAPHHLEEDAVNLKRTLLAPAVAIAALLPLSAGVASAAPKGEAFPVQCGGETLMIVTPTVANEKEDAVIFTPGFVVGSTTRLIPVQFTFTTTQGGTVLFSETVTKGGSLEALGDRLVSCTFRETFEGITFTGTVQALVTPQGGRSK